MSSPVAALRADVEAVDQHQDGGSGVGSSNADVVDAAVVPEAEFAALSITSRRTRGCGSAVPVGVAFGRAWLTRLGSAGSGSGAAAGCCSS